ncbi:biotin--[acetyl-CoA-carboxylase] ligase [Tissierella creatinophila]|uniref:Bifunctional ligase/repressor BirA n=1 Tax=Tissierella creatinophila DSM 6911 TaxID=1123403 RepID=A0A1U7M788_TISCR|nr:biotin--[acetyl-CoA-carboxylase] ligase [Tissierella creatinophila]OLS03145.1 bifunctional ligase/repressor BirA [Tissierella creatinophila DSM 6911]
MKNKILKRLKNSDDFVSGEKISQEFNMTRSGIWKYINMLKEEGYIIESIPRKGYRIISSPDILTLQEIENNLSTEFIGRNIYYYDTMDSTNKEAKRIASLEDEGTIVISEEQADGKGRLGRNWVSPKGKGIWMSIILKPDVEPVKVGAITLLGAASVFKGLKKMNIVSEIKWPNDILISEKKVCGILTEMSAELNMINHLIMGIGINVNLDEVDIPDELKEKATSIKIEQKKEIDRKLLLANILNEFEKLYIAFKDDGNVSKAIEICRENSVSIGREVRVIRGREERIGKALDINDRGELIVEFDDGKTESIFAGEVSVRGVNGYI